MLNSLLRSAINLDKMVGDVASGREIHDFRHSNKKAQKKNDKGRKSRYINFNVERQKILSQCHVVCCTLSGAGSKAFIESGKATSRNMIKYEIEVFHLTHLSNQYLVMSFHILNLTQL